MEAAIWFMLGALGCVAAFVAVERLLFHLTYRPADDYQLEDFLAKLRAHGRVPKVADAKLGWLRGVLMESESDNTKSSH